MKKRKKTTNKNRGLITILNPKSPISEQYRTVRTNIQFSAVDDSVHTLIVTSTGPGEGKSTTVANLAVVMAQQGKKVLLIDSDMRKPTVHYTFQLPNTIGLTNVLTKQISFVDAIRETEILDLFVLTSGPIPPNPAELLASKSMADLIEMAKEQFDLILFDAPPILAVTDAQILANLCDASLFVLSSGKTDREEAMKAVEMLKAAKGKLLGTVLNGRKEVKSSYYYYYGHN
ncbi:CpsD/CapB family tyrosine-protein kinase [Bacillus kwashiorkori]|uniref:CpsD/CapB family tyrosine-protein kinase n=1 Tax=Bacillus kwashiorkori TaxID=1522318 RepID=UPI00078032F6|nr:CpsD/CapB family tyrosine-protein kinase [Bacillus kwashiorkori]